MIAISYRRDDSLPITGRLYDRLQAKFGKQKVFMDFDSIPPGVDFRQKIKETIERANVMIAVIGPHWFGDQIDGSRRIDDPLDIVRLELEYALSRDIPIIPLLVNNTVMPKPEKLPSNLQALAFRNALPLDSGIDFHNHTDRLITGIHELGGRQASRPPKSIRTALPPGKKSRILWMMAATGLAVIVVGMLLLSSNWRARPGPDTTKPTNTAAPRPSVPIATVEQQQPAQISTAEESSPNEAGPSSPEPAMPAYGSLTISTDPEGAMVIENGRERGRTPLPIEKVIPGEVAYDLRLPGYKPGRVTAHVEPEMHKALTVSLEKAIIIAPGPEWTNSIGMKFVQLGAIRICIWETRVQDYDAFCNATGRRHQATDFEQDAHHPVVNVNWFGANAFCKWLTEKERAENVIEPETEYRLPTDLEWSMAAGLTDEIGATPEARDSRIKSEFPWGRQWPPPSGAGNYADRTAKHHVEKIVENYTDGFSHTSPVGNFKPNPLGIYDLGGNAWEWCADAYKGEDSPGAANWGVLRGGSWGTSSRLEIQSSYRNVVGRNESDVTYGFRCVLAPVGKSNGSQTANQGEGQ
jgi:hypothetical protein